jgi:glycosyltransferase involved in cell wall biosynthesis
MLKYGLIGAGAFLGSLALTDAYVHSEVNSWEAPLTPPPLTTIIMPTYNEEPWIEQALISLVNQNVFEAYPERFELIVADSQSTDATPEIAGKYANVLSLPNGKLNAKHLAILDAKGDVVVSVDADCYYGPNWLNLTLKPFERPNVVAVGGVSLSTHSSLNIGYLLQTWKLLLSKELIGRASAFRKSAYLQAGGYHLNFDQTNVNEVQYWEEIEFANRLRQLGDVVIEPKALVVTSPRLFYCDPRRKSYYPKLQNGVEYEFYCRQIESGERM